MNSRERVAAAVHFEKPDFIPVGPYMANHCSAMAGYSLRDCYTNGRTLAKAQYEAWKIYGQDIINVQSDNYYIPQAFPCTVTFPENKDYLPNMIHPPLSDLSRLSELSMPDPAVDGRMPVYLEAMRELREKVGQEAGLRACGVGPFTLAAHLRGTEAFLMELAETMMGESDEDEDEEEKEKAIEKETQLFALIDFCTDLLIGFSCAMLEAGADIVQCADSLASLDMISPDIYRKYAFPYEKKYFDAMKEPCQKKGAFRLLHICGDNTKSYPYFKKLDMDILELDSKVEMRYAREQLGEKHIALCGNLAPVAIIMQATPETVYQKACRAIEDAGAYGFILGSGCEVPIGTPKENIEAMIKASREYQFQS